jgi:hypothetical protein
MTRLVDITPHVSLLSKAGQSGHSVADAVAELVDNAIDARVEGRSLEVAVNFDWKAGWIEVVDDGHGMSAAELGRALVMALSAKAGERIGRFGLGMKTACTGLGPYFTIASVRDGDYFEAVAEYDQDRFLELGEWKLPIRRQRARRAHGTSIWISSPRIYASLATSLVRNLGWTFRHFIADGVLNLSVNGEPVAAPFHHIDQKSLLPLQAVIDRRAVRGWVALLTTSSQRGWYGFDLVRHRRVIRRHEKIGFQPHPQVARVVGELHLDDFDTNSIKTDFVRETEAWLALEAWVREAIDPVVAASRALAHGSQFDKGLRDLTSRDHDAVLTTLAEMGLGHLLEAEGVSRAINRSEAVTIVVGPFHVEHTYGHRPGEPYLRRKRSARDGEADILQVETNLGTSYGGRDAVSCALQNIAEAIALEFADRHDFVMAKNSIWQSIAAQSNISKALRRSYGLVRSSTTAVAGAAT